jgi:hypothetical protein
MIGHLKSTSFLPPVCLVQIFPQRPVLRYSSGSSFFCVKDKIAHPNEMGEMITFEVCVTFKWGSQQNNNVVRPPVNTNGLFSRFGRVTGLLE